MDNNKDNAEPGSRPDYDGPLIKWDDVTIAHEAEHMPPELRADYAWLKTFCREQCHRDIDILATRFRERGVMRDKTTWSKILRGRWRRDARGQETPTPVVAADKLAEEIEALRSNLRIESARGMVPFVETSTWHDISDVVEERCDSARANKWAMIVGATGSQKTACLREKRNRRNHGNTVLVEAPERGSFGEFLAMLSGCYGLSRKANFRDARSKIFEVLGSGTPAERARRCVIIDNAQELWLDKGVEQPAFTFLRRLQDTTGCTIVLSITPLFEKRLVAGMIEGWFEQIEGRTGGRRKWLRLPDYAPEEDVVAIAKAFGLAAPKQHLKELVKISREPGRIRRLFEDLQEGKLLAGKEPFTYAHIQEARGEL